MTLNQVIKNLSNIASAHYQIKSFGSGSIQDFASSGVTDYPAMWVDYENPYLQGKSYHHAVRIYVSDRLLKGKRNELDVLSDLAQVCLDIIAQLKSNIYEWVLDTSNISLNLFSEPKHDDEIAGYYFNVALKVNFDFNRCQIPFNGTITVPADQDSNNNNTMATDYTQSFTYTGGAFTLTASPSFVYSVRIGGLWLNESDSSDLTIAGTTLTINHPSFASGDTVTIKYKA